MANPQRIGLADGLNHVTARGDRCEAICFDEADSLIWLKLLGDLREVPRLQRRGPARPLADYAWAKNRNQELVAAYRSGYYTMKQSADYFGVHYATVSRAVRRSESE
tara:strand:- start:340 stop:660 length:321 start_codon:yes stop_codon:yes gene_type:complete